MTAEGKFFLFFKTGFWAHQASYSMCTGRSALGVKRPAREFDHSSAVAPTPNTPYAFVTFKVKGKCHPFTGHEGPKEE
jgi:hypothetical protein